MRSSCRISPRLEDYLLRVTSDLYLMGPPFDGLKALIMPKGGLRGLYLKAWGLRDHQ